MKKPIAVQPKDNRLGLGFARAKEILHENDMIWEQGADVVSVEETPEWLPPCPDPLDEEEPSMWETERETVPVNCLQSTPNWIVQSSKSDFNRKSSNWMMRTDFATWLFCNVCCAAR